MLEFDRNSVPAIEVAAHAAPQQSADALLLMPPSEHVIHNEKAFRETIGMATQVAAEQYFLTFGVAPDEPHAGYGYIRRGDALKGNASEKMASSFVEKPDAQTAARFLADGHYDWNSGMFMLKTSPFLDELPHYEP